jgi:A/G-specific adenine glycosylase
MKNIHKKIFDWYEKNGRHDLPWRATKDVYHIVVSEIMLQQTNVPKVIEKYEKFIEKYPTVENLAQASQKDVIRSWQGLGYNRRAIYLHKMAQIITNDHAGVFPTEPIELIALPGIGPYTSRSVVVFACNQNVVTWDVNIVRVFCRLHGERMAKDDLIEKWCIKLLPQDRSRDWHNALMDLASMICTKRSPDCHNCPLKEVCGSFPNPRDHEIKKKKEVGRTENGKHVPRRIYRGRIIEYLRKESGHVNDIGSEIKKDWNKDKDEKWCKDILAILEKEGMIMCKKGKWMLQ